MRNRGLTKQLSLPANVTSVLGTRRGGAVGRQGGRGPTASAFAEPKAPESLLPKFKAPVPGYRNIGLLHTSLSGAEGHDTYAPCRVAELFAQGFDYWALGHIHKRQVSRQGNCCVVMPGIPQGRHIGEAGPKTVTLVTIADDGSIDVAERITALAEFARVPIDVTGLADWSEILDSLEAALKETRSMVQTEYLVVRLELSGATSLVGRLRRDGDLLLAESRTVAAALGRTAVEKVTLDCLPPDRPQDARDGDPLAELGRLIQNELQDDEAFRDEIRQLVTELQKKLAAGTARGPGAEWRRLLPAGSGRCGPLRPYSRRGRRRHRSSRGLGEHRLMRLRRLELARYGCFTDFQLEFGAQDPAQADFHVVFGPNESGQNRPSSPHSSICSSASKSEAPTGFCTTIGPCASQPAWKGSARRSIWYASSGTGTVLLDAGDHPLPENLLTAVLGHLDRTSYTTMFSLDDDSLQSGGESILQSEGDLGRLLFSASSGLSSLTLRLDELREETDAFHRIGGRATELNRLKERLKVLKAQQVDLDVNARHYTELRQEAEIAAARHAAAKATRDRTRLRLGQVQRLLQALPIWADLQALDAALLPLEALPVPPASWHEEALELSQDAAAKATQILDAEKDVKRLSDASAALVVDQAVLAQGDAIERLKVDEGRFRGAEDIPAREAERAAVAAQIDSLCGLMGGRKEADPRALLLPAARKGALRSLIETASGMQARLEDAQRERDRAADAVARSEKTLNEVGPVPDVKGLERSLKRLRDQELVSRLAAAEARRDQIKAEMDQGLKRLNPWQGDLGKLSDLSVPGRRQVEDWREGRTADIQERRLTEKARSGN